MRFLDHILWRDLLNPGAGIGALFYAACFLTAAGVLAMLLRMGVNRLLRRDQHFHLNRTYFIFLTQLLQIGIYVLFFTFYTRLIPQLHTFATALLAGVSVISVIFGLAAQNTLGNLVAGIAVILYRPFQVGDTVQVVAPRGNEIGVVESISLGYTILVTSDHRRVMVPNSVVMSQTTVNLTHADPPVLKN
jgi:small conductance mechanosensitive channel